MGAAMAVETVAVVVGTAAVDVEIVAENVVAAC
jgi:hypothetical protein